MVYLKEGRETKMFDMVLMDMAQVMEHVDMVQVQVAAVAQESARLADLLLEQGSLLLQS